MVLDLDDLAGGIAALVHVEAAMDAEVGEVDVAVLAEDLRVASQELALGVGGVDVGGEVDVLGALFDVAGAPAVVEIGELELISRERQSERPVVGLRVAHRRRKRIGAGGEGGGGATGQGEGDRVQTGRQGRAGPFPESDS